MGTLNTREDVSTSMGRASANPTQVLWYNKSGIFNRLVPCSEIIFHSCLFYTKLLNSYDCAYVPIVSGFSVMMKNCKFVTYLK